MQPNLLKNFISKDTCNLLNDYLKTKAGPHPIDVAHPNGKYQLMVFNNNETVFFDQLTNQPKERQAFIFDIINLIQQSIATQFDLPVDQIHIKTMAYTVQEQGQDLSLHTDTGVSKNDVHSAILYLNDDYEGGEIVFYDTHLQEDPIPTKYKLNAGTLVFFPGTLDYPHEVMKVESGSRMAFVMFFEGIVPKD